MRPARLATDNHEACLELDIGGHCTDPLLRRRAVKRESVGQDERQELPDQAPLGSLDVQSFCCRPQIATWLDYAARRAGGRRRVVAARSRRP